MPRKKRIDFDLIGKKDKEEEEGAITENQDLTRLEKRRRRRRKNQNKNPGFDFVEEVVPGVVLIV